MSFNSFCGSKNATLDDTLALAALKQTFFYVQIGLCGIGIFGNILNLRTLQCPSLQTVPFMYIRALAVFDLTALSCIVLHFSLDIYQKKSYVATFYLVHLDAILINGFLVAGLYCAFMLTLERYVLISRPHLVRSCDPRKTARRRVFLALFLATLLHVPMTLQMTIQISENGDIAVTNNKNLLCHEPWWSVFQTYKFGRECLRFTTVVIMTILNVIIARKLQIAKRNRRHLLNRTPNFSAHRNSLAPNPDVIQRKEFATLMKSFTEKKLTVLMVAICFIFILGNVPQILVMVFQNESTDFLYGFQLYRNIANSLEVLNHCLNFYVFCTASKEYTRAFIDNCFCARNICPGSSSYRRRSSSLSYGQSVNNSVMLGPGRDYSDDETSGLVKDMVVRWKPDGDLESRAPTQGIPLVHAPIPGRSILRRERYGFRSHGLTIANVNALSSEENEINT